MRALEALRTARSEASLETAACALAESRLECVELRMALSALCEAVEAWGQWTMPSELAQAQHRAHVLLAGHRSAAVGV